MVSGPQLSNRLLFDPRYQLVQLDCLFRGDQSVPERKFVTTGRFISSGGMLSTGHWLTIGRTSRTGSGLCVQAVSSSTGSSDAAIVGGAAFIVNPFLAGLVTGDPFLFHAGGFGLSLSVGILGRLVIGAFRVALGLHLIEIDP